MRTEIAKPTLREAGQRATDEAELLEANSFPCSIRLLGAEGWCQPREVKLFAPELRNCGPPAVALATTSLSHHRFMVVSSEGSVLTLEGFVWLWLSFLSEHPVPLNSMS